MNTNKFFSPKRFARLLRNDLMINQKLYLLTLLGFSIALYAFTYFTMRTSSQYNYDDYFALFIVFLLGLGVIVGTAFPAINNQIKTSSYLLAPGSTIEKFLVQFTIRILVFVPIALFIFWICTYLVSLRKFVIN